MKESRRIDVWVGRLAAVAGIVYVLLASVWPLVADAEDRPQSPYFFVASDDPATDRLPLKSTTVDVKIAGVIADVVVTQRYRNQGRRPIDARYVFPGGTRSAVHAMTVRLGDRVLTADIREKQTFSGDDSVLAPQSLPATDANVARALRVIDRQSGGGSTELIPALEHAFALKKDADRSRTVVVVTDGYVTVEREAFDVVRRNIGDANLFAFGIGTSVNRFLIEGLARAGQGEPFVVTQESDAAAEAERFRRTIEAPVLTHVRMRFEGADGFEAYDVEPAALGDLFAARPVIVFGKWRGKPAGRLVVEGLAAAGPYRGSVDLAAAADGTDHPALRFLWARHRIASLADQERLDGTHGQAAAITALGLEYHLLTPYTSFVAVDRIVRTVGAATPVDMPSPLPAGVSDLAVGVEVPSTPEPSLLAMLAVAAAIVAAAVALRDWRVVAAVPAI